MARTVPSPPVRAHRAAMRPRVRSGTGAGAARRTPSGGVFPGTCEAGSPATGGTGPAASQGPKRERRPPSRLAPQAGRILGVSGGSPGRRSQVETAVTRKCHPRRRDVRPGRPGHPQTRREKCGKSRTEWREAAMTRPGPDTFDASPQPRPSHLAQLQREPAQPRRGAPARALRGHRPAGRRSSSAAIGVALQRKAARDDAIDDAKTVTAPGRRRASSRPNVTPALLRGDRDAIAHMDEVVRERISAGDGIERVKLWAGRRAHRLLGRARA